MKKIKEYKYTSSEPFRIDGKIALNKWDWLIFTNDELMHNYTTFNDYHVDKTTREEIVKRCEPIEDSDENFN